MVPGIAIQVFGAALSALARVGVAKASAANSRLLASSNSISDGVSSLGPLKVPSF